MIVTLPHKANRILRLDEYGHLWPIDAFLETLETEHETPIVPEPDEKTAKEPTVAEEALAALKAEPEEDTATVTGKKDFQTYFKAARLLNVLISSPAASCLPWHLNSQVNL